MVWGATYIHNLGFATESLLQSLPRQQLVCCRIWIWISRETSTTSMSSLSFHAEKQPQPHVFRSSSTTGVVIACREHGSVVAHRGAPLQLGVGRGRRRDAPLLPVGGRSRCRGACRLPPPRLSAARGAPTSAERRMAARRPGGTSDAHWQQQALLLLLTPFDRSSWRTTVVFFLQHRPCCKKNFCNISDVAKLSSVTSL